jgi:hypothetical protein
MTMTNGFKPIALAAAAFVLISAGAANAQLPETMRFKTTFPFMVGSTTLPAGAYTITPLPQDNALLQISNGHTSVLLMTENDAHRGSSRQDEVTFTRRGDTYVLKDIWDAASGSGVESLPTHAERAASHAKTPR